MNLTVQATIDFDMTFPTAGVGFAIRVRPGDPGTGAALSIQLQAVEADQTARFARESSYALADFVGGFCRWLGTKRVSVSYTEQEIHGHFHPAYTLPQLLKTTHELCQTLEDKFGGYPHSILA